jgi:hypothetical protein
MVRQIATEAGRERENMREAARHRAAPEAVEGTGAGKVTRLNGSYLVWVDGVAVGEASALNLFGEGVALDDGGEIRFNHRDYRVEPLAHKGGVLFIE